MNIKLKKKKIKIGIIGGKLQGLEVSYLAKEAGYHLTVIDKNKNIFSNVFADSVKTFDITKHFKKYCRIINKLDYFIPTNENYKTLKFIEKNIKKVKSTILFDFNSYWISSNKKKSKEVFNLLGLKTPKINPENPPFIIKPNDQSGSIGVKLISNFDDLKMVNGNIHNYLVEEFIDGPIISLEVIGKDGIYTTGTETIVHVDHIYDCWKVTPALFNQRYREIILNIARYINLNGIMDIESILDKNNNLYILEIDARFPSQTPICVYHSSGINLLKKLISINVDDNDYVYNKNYCIY